MAIGVDALYGSHPEHLHNAVAAGELSINGTLVLLPRQWLVICFYYRTKDAVLFVKLRMAGGIPRTMTFDDIFLCLFVLIAFIAHAAASLLLLLVFHLISLVAWHCFNCYE